MSIKKRGKCGKEECAPGCCEGDEIVYSVRMEKSLPKEYVLHTPTEVGTNLDLKIGRGVSLHMPGRDSIKFNQHTLVKLVSAKNDLPNKFRNEELCWVIRSMKELSPDGYKNEE